jgi:hypothetical protein
VKLLAEPKQEDGQQRLRKLGAQICFAHQCAEANKMSGNCVDQLFSWIEKKKAAGF